MVFHSDFNKNVYVFFLTEYFLDQTKAAHTGFFLPL